MKSRMNMKLRILFVSGMLVLLLLVGQGPASKVSSSPAPAQGAEVESLFNEMTALLISRADQYGVKIDPTQAKLFQFDQSPAVIAPITSFSLTNLGLIGLLEVGGPFTVRDTQLPGGLYRLEVGGDLASRELILYLRDESGTRVASIPASQVRTLSPSQILAAQGEDSHIEAFSNLIGPNLIFNVVLKRKPSFVKEVDLCLGYMMPFRSTYLSVGWCF